MKTYTIEQIRKYVESRDSLGDVLYYLDSIDEILEDVEKHTIEEDLNDASIGNNGLAFL
jgi:hypothetical protein